MNTRPTLEKAKSGQLALEALEGFSQHPQGRAGERAEEYKDFDFDWTDQSWKGPEFMVVVEVLKKQDGTVVCEAQVFDESGQEFSCVSYEDMQDRKAQAVIADYVLALKEGR